LRRPGIDGPPRQSLARPQGDKNSRKGILTIIKSHLQLYDASAV
jgi:hypothetical protein